MQVKIRGYRIELTEIESVLLQMPGDRAGRGRHLRAGAGRQRAGRLLQPAHRHGAPGRRGDLARRCATGCRRYMVPAYLEQLAAIPMTDQRQGRPQGAARRPRRRAAPARAASYVAPADRTETVLADALAEIARARQVSVDSHFFDDLGANSLLLAHFCATVRKAERPRRRSSMRTSTSTRPSGARRRAAERRPAAGRRRRCPRRTARVPAGSAVQLRPLRRAAAAGVPRPRRCSARCCWTIGPAVDLATRPTPCEIYLRSLRARRRRPSSAFALLPIAGQVAAGRPAGSRRRSALWSLRYLRFWAGQDADPGQPAGDVRRFPALPAVPARARREDRQAASVIFSAHRAGVHRPAHRSGRTP